MSKKSSRTFEVQVQHHKQPPTQIMAKRKAETLSETPTSGSKKIKQDVFLANKSNLLDDSASSGDDSDGGAQLEEPAFKINTEFAKRFEHNKKREELQRRKSIHIPSFFFYLHCA